jgi:hypothetical protein
LPTPIFLIIFLTDAQGVDAGLNIVAAKVRKRWAQEPIG